MACSSCEAPMNEQGHRVTWLCRSMELVAGKESTNYACACGQSEPVEIHPRPLMDNDPHSNATHKVFFFMSGERGAALLDDILEARVLAGLAQEMRGDTIETLRARMDGQG